MQPQREPHREPHPDPLVAADDLAARLASVTVLDVRYRMGGPGGPDEVAAGHLPGASYVDLDRDLADPPGPGGRHPLPDPERFAAAMRRCGVRADRPVVVYDDWAGHAAGRCWWLLRHHGHDDVRVLDGGLAAWRAAGLPLETGSPAPVEPGDFTARVPGRLPVVEAADLASVTAVVDARAPERYRGEVEPVDAVAGHVPGAVNVPTATNLRDDGTFRDADDLRARYAAAGVPVEGDGAAVAVYCGSGVTAAHDLIALERIGVTAALYPGSWSGWITDPERPVETGPGG